MTDSPLEVLWKIFKEHPVVTTDTRNIPEESIFFALKGPNFDGNTFAAQALEKGAVLAVTDNPKWKDTPQMLYCEDVLTLLQQLALLQRQQLNIPVIAITGSNGKTTTKELVHAVLSKKYKTSTTVGNLNNHIGIPLTLLRIPAGTEIAVIEMGANHQKEIAGYCTYTLPTHGMITNCGKAHLEGFGGTEGIKKGKGELFDFLVAQQGIVFVCKDFSYFQQMVKEKSIRNIIWYGSSTEVMQKGTLLNSEPFIKVAVQKEQAPDFEIQTQLVGDYNLFNVLAAVTIGRHFGIDDSIIKMAIEAYAPDNSRSQLVKKGSNTIIFDAYNANPSSMAAAIDNFSKLSGDNKILILGAMAELGESTADEHLAIAEQIRNFKWQEVVLVGAAFKPHSDSFLYFENAAETAIWWQKAQIKNAQILLKGSRSMAMEKVLNK
jgi:UDP-N-acetylmuramoyl-tripeptide--D-alanyl-D-alanine ligase